MKIAVLSGGISPERDVSLSSGAMIATALSERGHLVAYTDILDAKTDDDIRNAFKKGEKYSYSIPSEPPMLDKIRKEKNIGAGFVGRGIIHLCEEADVTFLALHGGAGEDGRISALFESLGIKHTGSDFASCHLAMDKSLSKTAFIHAGIPVPKDIIFSPSDIESIPLPAVVKPVGCGSSIGVSIVYDREELTRALKKASGFGCRVMIEKYIKGREFSVGILCGKALPAIEIRPQNDSFYDYSNKYQAGATLEICPAELSSPDAKRLGELALAAHNALGLGTYSRLDFILGEKDNEFYCLEANSLPGMTPASLLPQEAAAVGISYGELCEMIAGAAI